MRASVLRSWVVLAALASVVYAAVSPSGWSEWAAGLVCLAGVVLLVCLDGQRKRGLPRHWR